MGIVGRLASASGPSPHHRFELGTIDEESNETLSGSVPAPLGRCHSNPDAVIELVSAESKSVAAPRKRRHSDPIELDPEESERSSVPRGRCYSNCDRPQYKDLRHM